MEQVSRKISFGWTFKTHSRITDEVVKNSSLSGFSEKFQKYVAEPDKSLSLRGIFCRNHFLSFSKNSFVFGPNKPNLKSSYQNHINKMKNALKDHDFENAIKYCGYALHYLQDTTMPLHTQNVSFWNIFSPKNIFRHKGFERDVYANIENILKNITKNYKQRKTDNFDKLFSYASYKSLSAEKPSYDKSNWGEVASENIKAAKKVTERFVKLVETEFAKARNPAKTNCIKDAIQL